MAKEFSISTPVRLQEVVLAAFTEEYGHVIEEHGPSFAVNSALAAHLRKRGYEIPNLQTKAEKLADTQNRRWEETRKANEIETEKERRQREQKRERDKRYRENKKKAKAENALEAEES